MKLAIADPPYPPNLLAASRRTGHGAPSRASRWYTGRRTRTNRGRPADNHPQAADWDRVERHAALLAELVDRFDGWAIATVPDAIAAGVYDPLPYGTRVMAWVKTNAMPTGSRIASRWEAVLVYPPDGRHLGRSEASDVLAAPAPGIGFAGAKPAAWTRWVLDALGYDPETDTVADLFPGSGSVGAVATTYSGALL